MKKRIHTAHIRRSALTAVIVIVAAFCRTAYAEELPDANPMSGDQKAINSGKSWFRGVCALCHGGRADGAGERGNGADLRKFDKGFKAYVHTVKEGRKIAGRNQEMPAWGGVLEDKTIYEIGAYLETLAMEGANWKEGVKH
jgi:mono/diheme cytochrome c family protein